MAKGAVVVLAGTEGREAIGRIANALVTAREFKEAGDEIRTDDVERAGVALLDEYDQHPSIRRLLAEGYSVVTF